jgi:hypothetical protein
MNPQNEIPMIQSLEIPPSLLPGAPAHGERPATTTGSDRLYQLAALTAGAFLLATLL